jgi:hypothetical protein
MKKRKNIFESKIDILENIDLKKKVFNFFIFVGSGRKVLNFKTPKLIEDLQLEDKLLF